MDELNRICKDYENEITDFLRKIISIQSYTGEEKEVAKTIKQTMEQLGYDDIIETEYGDVIGVLGDGNTTILIDSHMDTVVVNDADQWKHDPFGGDVVNGKMYGRGASDMKSAIASSVYAGYFAKKMGLLTGKTVYVSASVMEEDFDGFALKNIIEKLPKKPDAVVIGEPSDRQIALGHRGRALLEVHTKGVSCHGSAPENGVNAVYEMSEIIQRVNELNNTLYKNEGQHGSVVLSKIESTAVSLNAVPDECTIYLDRRLANGETFQVIEKEMNTLIEGTKASWNVYDALGRSYTEKEFAMHSFMESWAMDPEDPITVAMKKAFEGATGEGSKLFHWNFSTNGFASTAKGIPTIGYGPGIMKCCHMKDEHCEMNDVFDATRIYAKFINEFNN
ncbi:YgeY family selenium metabolism-linked hydrolase [Desulfoluna spongiiphila]|uniref:Putative selenium metabolism hydrolase n=1 Tax=Desulfoluna spongiiphila TaxID=419481 RepID=A0A1G5F7Q8_9BACT|nr:YgeY family selenium metabolism-linked hydrolase [Desulfoluna spongiiphila]SCY35306.1 putative selenium metabolism hydrolase [Desulfoluna spongiiphila]